MDRKYGLIPQEEESQTKCFFCLSVALVLQNCFTALGMGLKGCLLLQQTARKMCGFLLGEKFAAFN